MYFKFYYNSIYSLLRFVIFFQETKTDDLVIEVFNGETNLQKYINDVRRSMSNWENIAKILHVLCVEKCYSAAFLIIVLHLLVANIFVVLLLLLHE